MLEGVNVALGVTGSIAAVKTVELAHELRRQGASVRAVTSDSARSIVHPWALEFATGNDVVTEITGAVEHVELCGDDGWADVLLIAPATANTIGKIASAIDDTPVTTCATTALGAGVPIVIAPAMHEPMYEHPGVLDAIERVESWGVDVLEPRVEEGKAKIATAATIVRDVARAVGDESLAGRHVVVTTGATTEAIDPVRVVTNRSSGRMGRAIAEACYVRGADVTVIHGVVGPHGPSGTATDELVPPFATMREVETVEEMLAATEEAVADADALVSAAAIGDFTTEAREEKIRSGQTIDLTFTPTPKLIDEVREGYAELPIVGFKAETSGDDQRMVEAARETLERVGLAFVVVNDASVMGADDTRVLLVHATDAVSVEGPKRSVADEVAESLGTILE